jgi:hypothetical protein
MKNLFKVDNGSKNMPTKAQKPFWKEENQLILVNFHTPESRSALGSAFPIRIRIQDSKINADPDPKHGSKKGKISRHIS